ncbi:Nuclear poly(A) polymerase 1 [Coniochaeta hoffmannii]|uniref:polynucleotide adenylyltransferase n=1 Tax=Coniochaeta hoffmannii TaxID=91930 RepID=A0AA38VE60_9PEZI|nr:Nuclear poly(A) polymerase 1 [Coniochaeta hoffmannii]
MAAQEAININSHHTALSLVLPRHLWPPIDRLRALYDKAYEKWPPHINLIYPFVLPDHLPRAAESIQAALQRRAKAGEAPLRVCLDTVDVFPHKHDNTIFLHDSDQKRTDRLVELRRDIVKALGQRDTGHRMHMTVAQSEDIASSKHKFLQHKVGLLPPAEWEVEELHILVREQLHVGGGRATSQLKVWGTFNLSTGLLTRHDAPKAFYGSVASAPIEGDAVPEIDELRSQPCYYYDDEMLLWLPYREPPTAQGYIPQSLAVSSYNVLGEFDWPPTQSRYPLIVKNILSRQGVADILVLQEVTDDFLSYLLRDERIRDLYPFTSHGPPDQSDVEPLPSLVNIVVLSKWASCWEWVPLSRKHKGAVVARFGDIGRSEEDGRFTPTVVAAVHLNHGLTDGAVTAKKVDIQNMLGYLACNYSDHPLILAGDFNISTSVLSINAAVKKGAISAQSAGYLESFDRMFEEAKFADAWRVSRFKLGEASDTDPDADEEFMEGERGATYNPLVNEVAASIVGSGFNMRPQRYDRILVRGEGLLSIAAFNKFGFVKGRIGDEQEATYASDHWGVRCFLKTGSREPEKASEEIAKLIVPVDLSAAPQALSDPSSVEECLTELGIFPNDEDIQNRQSAFDLLKHVLQERDTQSTSYHKSRSPLVIVPVGSYGLGVWISTSDMDVLCIGPFSSATFFSLAVPRLRKAADQGIRILRRVKAHSGTMLELEVRGIKTDLQYCPATSISENWPHVLRCPATDPIWTLPTQTLSKLKAVRDMDYLRRSVPDLAKFRVAHRFVRTWARSRGIYSARFGYLGGMQISVLLARVHKLLARDNNPGVSVPDVLTTFFRHYAEFDWKKELVFDPFFHRQRLNYARTSREPLAVLGYFPPALNTAQAASVPSVRTIAEEFRRAVRLLDSGRVESWTEFLAGGGSAKGELSSSGAEDFLGTYKSYAKIDVQYWGLSLSRGAQFVGWLESRFVNVLVDIERRLAGVLHARMWPARFVESAAVAEEDADDGAGPRDYQGCYLVGLGKLHDAQLGKDEMRDALGALQAVLRRFEEQIRGDDRYFDRKSCWMSASVVSGAEIKELGLVVDGREWGEYSPGEEEVDEEEEEELDVPEAEGDEDLTRKKKGKSTAETVIVPKLESGKKFRTAADVINRLRWDPGMDSGDFIVGYEDRFVGAREKALNTWKSEQTDEEFIPQHRILYFKRKSDGVVVWERRTRKDEVFGSGI